MEGQGAGPARLGIPPGRRNTYERGRPQPPLWRTRSWTPRARPPAVSDGPRPTHLYRRIAGPPESVDLHAGALNPPMDHIFIHFLVPCVGSIPMKRGLVPGSSMPLEGSGRLLEPEKSRTLIYVSQAIANDSAFPFEASQSLQITIDPEKERLIIRAADEDD